MFAVPGPCHVCRAWAARLALHVCRAWAARRSLIPAPRNSANRIPSQKPLIPYRNWTRKEPFFVNLRAKDLWRAGSPSTPPLPPCLPPCPPPPSLLPSSLPSSLDSARYAAICSPAHLSHNCDQTCDRNCDSICDSNFGPDPLYNGIHFSIRNTFMLCMYIHKSTLVYIVLFFIVHI